MKKRTTSIRINTTVPTKTPEKPYVRSQLRDVMEAKAYTKHAGYNVTVSWDYLERWIADHQTRAECVDANAAKQLDLDPDFQRAHVWTKEQQTAYVEYVLRGGRAARELYFNCAGWMGDWRGPFVIVDGKQRMEAARAFMRGEVPAFGKTLPEWQADAESIGAGTRDCLGMTGPGFTVYINDLKTRQEVLRWYLDLNTGGTPHTDEEISKVQVMLDGVEPEEKRDVHTEHCCGYHKACKFGHDNCTVATGKKRPSCPCNCRDY